MSSQLNDVIIAPLPERAPSKEQPQTSRWNGKEIAMTAAACTISGLSFGLAGFAIGAIAGAVIASVLGPVGTITGAIIGGAIGATVGAVIGVAMAILFSKAPRAVEIRDILNEMKTRYQDVSQHDNVDKEQFNKKLPVYNAWVRAQKKEYPEIEMLIDFVDGYLAKLEEKSVLERQDSGEDIVFEHKDRTVEILNRAIKIVDEFIDNNAWVRAQKKEYPEIEMLIDFVDGYLAKLEEKSVLERQDSGEDIVFEHKDTTIEVLDWTLSIHEPNLNICAVASLPNKHQDSTREWIKK